MSAARSRDQIKTAGEGKSRKSKRTRCAHGGNAAAQASKRKDYYRAIGTHCADVQRASGLEHYQQHGAYVLTEEECIASRTAMGVLWHARGSSPLTSTEFQNLFLTKTLRGIGNRYYQYENSIKNRRHYCSFHGYRVCIRRHLYQRLFSYRMLRHRSVRLPLCGRCKFRNLYQRSQSG